MPATAGGAPIHTDTLLSTAGLVIQSAGQRLLVTAGHGVGATGSLVYDEDDEEIGTVETNFYRDGTTVDLALVKLFASYVDFSLYAVRLKIFDTEQVYTEVRPAAERAEDGTFVIMMSPSNGAEFGKIVHHDADITTPEYGQVTNVCVADYPSRSSDSGAPVISTLANGAICYGFHGGRFTAQGTEHAWFTPLDNLDLTLD